jgi:riboflavin synthase
MFTGIVERSLRVLSVEDLPGARRITIENPWPDVNHGESVAVNGVCLTIARLQPKSIGFDAILETLQKTNLGDLKPGDEVHVERAMRIGDRFDGHFVQGHVDGTATVVWQEERTGEWRTRLRLPDHLAKYLSPKGSIALDGISMTIALIDGSEFEVALIPTTLQITRLGQRPPGSRINVECDTLAKTIVHFLEARGL